MSFITVHFTKSQNKSAGITPLIQWDKTQIFNNLFKPSRIMPVYMLKLSHIFSFCEKTSVDALRVTFILMNK